ncbi:MAG: response regulator [bacterium]|nr:response regulator [bacterium]
MKQPAVSFAPSTERRTRILLIEDDEPQRELFRTVLEDAGYEVLEASDGQRGIRAFQEQPCDLVITDIFMPNKDGLETIMAIKTASPGVKIIAISGGGSWEQHGEFVGTERSLGMASRFGADRTFQKPVSIQQLLEMLEKLLPKRTQT